MRFAPTSYRPLFGRILAVVVVVIAATGVAGFIVAGVPGALLRFAWPLLLLATLAIALYWRPRLDIAEHEVTVVNVFSTVHVPWPAIERVDTKYALTLHTLGGVVTVWASPAPNRYAAQSASHGDAQLGARAEGFAPRPGDLPTTASGAAAFVIRTHLDDLRAAGHLDAPVLEGGRLRRERHVVTIVVLAALTVATVLGLVL